MRQSSAIAQKELPNGLVFQVADSFMIRCPALPVQAYAITQSQQNLLDEWFQNGYLREAIAVSSPSLYQLILNPKSEGHVAKTSSSLLRYALRMSTRPTPFGLMAGVAMGQFGDHTSVQLAAPNSWRKRTRFDMGWIVKLIQQLESRPDVYPQLPVYRNPLAVKVGDRYNLPYRALGSSEASPTQVQQEAVSIRATPAVDIAMGLAETPLRFADVIAGVLRSFPFATHEQVFPFIQKLFEQEFLLSGLRPPLTIPNPIEHVLQVLDTVVGVEADRAKLTHIESLLKTYDQAPVGTAESLLEEVLQQTQGLAQVDTPIQVDLRLGLNHFELNQEIKADVAAAATLLCRLSEGRTHLPHLESYRDEFLSQYGDDRLVPVAELLDEDTGLGPPDTYDYHARRGGPERHGPQPETRQEHLIFAMACKALGLGTRELELTDRILQELQTEVSRAETPLSLELNFAIAANTPGDVDAGEYLLVLGPNIGSYGAGKTFGRFADLLGPAAADLLTAVHEAEKWCEPDAVRSEIAYLPQRARIANVSLAPNVREYQVAIGTSPAPGIPVLPLSDLHVGIKQTRLYLWSASLRTEVRVTTGHMLNTGGSPNLYKFLREVSDDGRLQWRPWSWGKAESFPFLPRVRHGRIVLAPAQWRLQLSLLASEKGLLKDDHAFAQAIARWRTDWSVPRYIYLSVSDNRLLLDLDNPLHRRELREAWKPNPDQALILQEALPSPEQHWVAGPGGNYASEFVFPMVRLAEPVASTDRRSPSTVLLDPKTRVRLPGSDWLYLKLYHAQSREDEFLTQHIRPFAQTAVENGWADRWFFIRFADPLPHVRLRFQGVPEHLITHVLPHIHEWAWSLQEKGLLKDLQIATYDREIERYGGPELAPYAEAAFTGDSATALALLNLRRTGQVDLEPVPLAAVSMANLLDQFGLPRSEQVQWLRSLEISREYGPDHRPWRRRLLDLIDPDQRWIASPIEGLSEALDLRRPAVEQYAKRVWKAFELGHLSTPPQAILGSLIHMHCNRLMGIDREAERRAMAFCYFTLYSQQQKSGVAIS